jgi:hypothetical protein
MQRLYNTLLYMVIHILYRRWSLVRRACCCIHLKNSSQKYLYIQILVQWYRLASRSTSLPGEIR